MDQSIIELYDDYTHKPLERRVFLERLVVLTGSLPAATAALALLEPSYAAAQTVPANDPRIAAGREVDEARGLILYRARPTGPRVPGTVIVIHENRGLNPHTEDVARRFALAGFSAIAPDYLAPLGGTPTDADQARTMIGQTKPETVIETTSRILAKVKAETPQEKVGAVGFCWGGGVVNRLATALPDLAAGVVFYGVAPPLADVAKIRAPLLIHLAGVDKRVNDTYPPYEEALKAAGKRYRIETYADANHAFLNDTSAERYKADAANLAFERTVAFFKAELA
jgi:carboxymethylenebutenolidase